MNEKIKKRLIGISLPTLVVVVVLYGSLYIVWRLLVGDEELCKKTMDILGSGDVSLVCTWIQLSSLKVILFNGITLIPLLALGFLLLFGANHRISALEKELKDLKGKLNA